MHQSICREAAFIPANDPKQIKGQQKGTKDGNAKSEKRMAK